MRNVEMEPILRSRASCTRLAGSDDAPVHEGDSTDGTFHSHHREEVSKEAATMSTATATATATTKTAASAPWWWTAQLFVSVLLGLVSGSLYGFGRYSMDLKETLWATQVEVQRYGILLDCGNYIGHPAVGVFYDRFGPRRSCLAAAVVVFGAYLSLHLGTASVDGTTALGGGEGGYQRSFFRSPAVVGSSFFLVGFGSGLGFVAALGATTKRFRGTPNLSKAVGIVAAGFGLSSSLVGITYSAVGEDPSEFFLLWAVLVAAANVVGACLLREEGTSPPIGGKAVVRLQLEHGDELSSTTLIGSGDIMAYDEHLLDTPPPPPSQSPEKDEERNTKWESWRTPDFWILFASFLCCTGCGLFVINNVSTMVQSFGGTDEEAAFLVVLLSLCNCGGRIAMGSLASSSSGGGATVSGSGSGAGEGKIDLFRLVALLMAAAMFFGAATYGRTATFLGDLGGLPAMIAIVLPTAVAYGGTWVLVVCVLSEWFGNRDFGKNYGLMAMAPALSGMVFNAASARVYQRHLDPQPPGGGAEDVCTGPKCYHGAFVLTGISAIVGFLLLSYLSYHRRGRRSKEAGRHDYGRTLSDNIEIEAWPSVKGNYSRIPSLTNLSLRK